jgi:hypothetical protein
VRIFFEGGIALDEFDGYSSQTWTISLAAAIASFIKNYLSVGYTTRTPSILTLSKIKYGVN